jgi:hypothetical protein
MAINPSRGKNATKSHHQLFSWWAALTWPNPRYCQTNPTELHPYAGIGPFYWVWLTLSRIKLGRGKQPTDPRLVNFCQVWLILSRARLGLGKRPAEPQVGRVLSAGTTYLWVDSIFHSLPSMSQCLRPFRKQHDSASAVPRVCTLCRSWWAQNSYVFSESTGGLERYNQSFIRYWRDGMNNFGLFTIGVRYHKSWKAFGSNCHRV